MLMNFPRALKMPDNALSAMALATATQSIAPAFKYTYLGTQRT